jgi:SAM-dependent methyltransferase
MNKSNEKHWFAEWFDSAYYHILYEKRDEQEATLFIDRLVDYLQIQPHHKILDLACGKGRHAIYLNKKGFDVEGVDLSAESIKHNKQYENDRLHFAVADMRNTYKPITFDFILNLFTSFGYFDDETDNQKVVNAMKQGLKSDGLLVIDFMNVHKTIKNLVPHQTITRQNIDFKLARYLHKGFITKDIFFTDGQQSYQFQERVKALDMSHFAEYFAEAGLSLKQTFGDYELSPFSADTSDRLIMIVENKQE